MHARPGHGWLPGVPAQLPPSPPVCVHPLQRHGGQHGRGPGPGLQRPGQRRPAEPQHQQQQRQRHRQLFAGGKEQPGSFSGPRRPSEPQLVSPSLGKPAFIPAGLEPHARSRSLPPSSSSRSSSPSPSPSTSEKRTVPSRRARGRPPSPAAPDAFRRLR